MKRLMIAGFGDVARRALPRLEDRFEVLRIARRYGSDLDRPESLALEGAHALFHCAPPPGAGESDTRTANLLAALEKGRILPARVVYVSTSGVYGDCAGARVDESRPPAPRTPRARRRVDAERRLTLWCEARGIALVILRAPGIYAADRLPLERLRAGTPVLRAADDVYTSAIQPKMVSLDPALMSYSVSWNPDNRQGSTVTCTVTYRWLPEILLGGINLSSTSVMPMSY